jgi:hypothetical protein
MSVKQCPDCGGDGNIFEVTEGVSTFEDCGTCEGTGYVADCGECKIKKALADVYKHFITVGGCVGCDPQTTSKMCASSTMCKSMARAKEAMEETK